MLIKLSPIFHPYARHKEEKIEKALTRQQWIIADRIIMAIMLLSVIVAAVAFS
jgi:thymidylate kinase